MPHVLAALCSRCARCRAALCTKPVIRPCRRRDLPAFCGLLARYFREDLHLPLTDEQAQELTEDIYAEIHIGVPLELAFVNGEAVGFIDHQTDHPASSWCFHEGWACIRELYVVPEHRSHGIARALLAHDMTAKGIISCRTASIEVVCEEPLAWTLDGEFGGSVNEAKISVEKKAIRYVTRMGKRG